MAARTVVGAITAGGATDDGLSLQSPCVRTLCPTGLGGPSLRRDARRPVRSRTVRATRPGKAAGLPRPGGPPPGSRPAVPSPGQAPVNMSEIYGVGVVQAIDVPGGRVTIAYEPIEGVNWPAGAMPFQVAKAALHEGVVSGEKVRFRLETQQIADPKPFTPGQSQQRLTRSDRPVAANGRSE